MNGTSGLTRPQRHIARERAMQAALLGLHHASELHYTQGSERWEGINHHDVASKGQYPKHADCSAFATWCLWNGMYLPFGVHDVVNGQGWEAGYTGTMKDHGIEVVHVVNVIRGDLVLYGPKGDPEHVAIVVGHKGGVVGSRGRSPIVVSNGSEAGPFLLDYNYRSDVGEIRRYI